jgi:hypothetical protein
MSEILETLIQVPVVLGEILTEISQVLVGTVIEFPSALDEIITEVNCDSKF